ncbi:hypothetical protein V500_06879 [Pseudogymnoascus sp. VKM F-4518 (FW-2643)]|nr:hypothetical protein V500_06879 [Pseudogymnoascus sp. VKM F-4518 (FW-2643)]
MAPSQAGFTPTLSTFLAYLKDKENNPVESCIELLISLLKQRQIRNSRPCAVATAKLLRRVVSSMKWRDAEDLIRRIQDVGQRLMEAQPREMVVGNIVRRVLGLIRDEILEDRNEDVSSDAGSVTPNRMHAAPALSHPRPSTADSASARSPFDQHARPSLMTSHTSYAVVSGVPAVQSMFNLLSATPSEDPTPPGVPSPSDKGIDAAALSRRITTSTRDLKSEICDGINEIIDELLQSDERIAGYAHEHIHSNEIILTHTSSQTVHQFLLKAAAKRKFTVIVAESYPNDHEQTHSAAMGVLTPHDDEEDELGLEQFQKSLTAAGLTVVLITDSSVFAIMSRVNKVILATHAVIANGGLVAASGARIIAKAAHKHRTPVIVVSGVYKLSPQYPYEFESLIEYGDPSKITTYEDGDFVEEMEVENPLFDYVPPELVDLYITNLGAHAPSYLYRIVADHYKPEDTNFHNPESILLGSSAECDNVQDFGFLTVVIFGDALEFEPSIDVDATWFGTLSAMDNAPPPPYSETDIYSNSGRSPLGAPPDLSRSTTQTDDASQASTSNSVIYTPAESVDNDSYASAARLYFDSRPHPRKVPRRPISHEIVVGPMSTPDDLPYIPEFADLDITTQDWATFINYVIPHHIDQANGLVASEKMKAEVLDRRMHGLTLSSESASDLSAVDAQLNNLQPSKVDLSEPPEDDVAAVVLEWNTGFFGPRGVRILANVSEPDPPSLPPRTTTEQAATRSMPSRPGWQTTGSETTSDRDSVGKEREPRGWGWGPQGPGGRGRHGCGYGDGHGHGHGRGRRGHGRHERGDFDREVPRDGFRGFGRRGGLVRADASGFHVGSVMSAGNDGFRLGPMVADKSGFRIGNMLVANDDGFKLGSMTFGNSNNPSAAPPNPYTERGRNIKEGGDKNGRDRSRSISSHSSSSDDTVGTEDSEGSLPDVSDLKPNQLHVVKQSLMEWLNHPEQPVSKETVKSLKKDIKLAKWARKPEGQELTELKAELKALTKAFKELKKSRAVKRKSLRKERRKQRKELRSQAKQKRREERAARRSRGKGKEKAATTYYDEYAPCETGFVQNGTSVPEFPNGPPGMRNMPSIPGFPNGPPGMHNMPSIPGFPKGPPSMHIPGSFPGAGFNPLSHDTPRSPGEVTKVQEKREHLGREAERILADARAMHKEAEETRLRADQEEDEKSTLKLLDVAKDLDVEVEKLYEAADRFIAESVHLEEYLRDINGGEMPQRDTADKDLVAERHNSTYINLTVGLIRYLTLSDLTYLESSRYPEQCGQINNPQQLITLDIDPCWMVALGSLPKLYINPCPDPGKALGLLYRGLASIANGSRELLVVRIRGALRNMKIATLLTAACVAFQGTAAAAVSGKPSTFIRDYDKRDLLQDVVTWDEHSLFIHGKRAMIFSGEVHPWRLPVPSLWLDLFEKIKALGYNTVSFYVDWNLLEGKQGEFRADGVFAYEPFFEAATKAGIWLIARPGPYINAEVAAGGLPGWLQRIKGMIRTNAEDYMEATELYVASIGAIIAKAQITNGGPVILYQPENEYSGGIEPALFPDGPYFQRVIDQVRKAGIVVPLINNDAWSGGHNAPGTGLGEVDIYAHDNYPIGFDCSDPTVWPADGLRTDQYSTRVEISPNTPYTIPEFQGGAFSPWGGWPIEKCAELVNQEAERVLYKNNYAAGISIMNLYMTYGGLNWGNLGHYGGFSTYDYGAAIKADRTITREKYSEAKLQAQFLKASPDYLTAVPTNLSTTLYTDNVDLAVTPVIGSEAPSSFYIVRHNVYNSTETTTYSLNIATSAGKLTVPRLGGKLTLNGRDSKVHVTDYNVGGTTLLYSTAEVFTWKKFDSGKVLILYGGPEELHEASIVSTAKPIIVEGKEVTTKSIDGNVVLQWKTSTSRRIVKIGDLSVYILDRNSAYNYWVPDLADGSAVIVKAGYLVRTAAAKGNTLQLTGDFNATTPFEVIGAPKSAKKLTINGQNVAIETSKSTGSWHGLVKYQRPFFNIPNLENLQWKSTDALPEIQTNYDDSEWPAADKTTSTNTYRNLTTPTSLYSSDYGFHYGYLIYRGHFVATGEETTITIYTQGRNAYGTSAWLNGVDLGSNAGNATVGDSNSTYTLGKLSKGKPYVLTMLMDNLGYDGNWVIGSDSMKNPNGILHYEFPGRKQSDITWKLTGNLGGEDYVDKTRGPLNEGGLFPERQGWHQQNPPTHGWKASKPTTGISKAGVAFYTAELNLNIPKGWDVPLSFTFKNTKSEEKFRAQLYVNGYQFGKYINNIGPQVDFSVPQGILNYQGSNTVALTLWAQQPSGAKLQGLSLTAATPVLTALNNIELVPMPKYAKRAGAY